MLVRCPKCRTTFKVSDDRVKGSVPAFRCSRCKHTFDLELHNAPETSADLTGALEPPTPDRTQAEELRLPFEPKLDRPAYTGNNETFEAAPAPADDFAARVEPGDSWSLSDPNRQDEHQFVLPDSDPPIPSSRMADVSQDFPADDPFFPKADGDEAGESNILAISSYREQKASILPFVTLFGLLVIGFTFISVMSYAKPQAAEGVIKQIPLVGSSVLKNNHLKNGILIESLRSGHQTIQGNRDVFLISGVARNQNPEVVREIQLSGVAYNAEGKEVERQTIWVGNTISPKIIRGMTTEDIPHLQNLKPLKSFEIPPGDSIPFTIVFLKSAKNAKEFSCEVLTAGGAD
jgi:predicted Zn finger-like uncharacterized protein